MASLVLTAIGDDRPGLVTALSDLVTEHGGNWERSTMAELAGKFAGIVLVTLPDQDVDGLVAALDTLRDQGLLDVRAERATTPAAAGGESVLRIELVGSDRPGIVREISKAVASCGASIDELSTATSDAPMAGGTLFEAQATVHLPAGVDASELQTALEAVANELMVDLTLSRPE
jgi:glycine cleavage system regulatory protein